MRVIKFLVIAGALVCAQTAFTQESGKEMFQQRCAACHTVGGGRLVGPDLVGVTERRPERWLIEFVKSSQGVIQSGDKAAGAIFEEFNKIVMPDHALPDDQIKEILTYIKNAGGSPSTQSERGGDVPAPIVSSTVDDIKQGQALFQGKRRFVNDSPSCISCHNNDAVFGGGALAKDLTMVFSRLGEPGIHAILANPPFPVMQAAYEGRPLEEAEIRALVGFLQHADQENTLRQPRKYGWVMFGAGMGGVGLLLGFYSLMSRRRKRCSVNQDIYDRQDKSE